MVDLSVCITVYNLESVIDNTIESVLMQQTEYTYEILIGDDGSIDGTVEKIKQWEEKYPQIIRCYSMPREVGKKYFPVYRASQNRLALLKKAQGKYITFLDGDDFYTSNLKFQKQIEVLEKFPNCSCCAHNMNYFYPTDNRTEPILPVWIKRGIVDSKRFLRYHFYIPAEACIFRNEFVIQERHYNWFDDNMIIYYSLHDNGDMYYIPENMANYRQNETGFLSYNKDRIRLLNVMAYDVAVEAFPDWKTILMERDIGTLRILAVHKKKGVNYAESNPDYYQMAKDANAKCALSFYEGEIHFRDKMKYTLLSHKCSILSRIGRCFCSIKGRI